MAVWDRFACKELSATLAYVGELCLDKHTAICIGDVLGPSGPILVGSEMEAILCLPPNPFPSAFSTCFITEPPTNFMWLVPISSKEAMAVKNSGTEHLMLHWLREGTDLLNLNRKCTYPNVR